MGFPITIVYQGETIVLNDNENIEPISGIKQKIIAETIPGVDDASKISLSYNSVVLNDNETILFYGIDKSSGPLNMTYSSDTMSDTTQVDWIPVLCLFLFLLFLILSQFRRKKFGLD